MAAKVEIDVVTKEDVTQKFGQIDAKFSEFSANLTKQTQSYMAVQRQKDAALKDAADIEKRAQEQMQQANQASRLSWTELNSAIMIGQTVIREVGKAYNETVGEAMKYDQQIRDLTAITGTSAEESSRFVQVLDDYQISVDDVTIATKKMTSQGLVPNLETLAQLSDEYNAIQDPLKQNEFLIKNLGKSGLQWVNVLKQGGDALRAQGAAVDQHLIVTEKAIKAEEEWRLNVDALSDSWHGFTVALGNAVIPALNDAIDYNDRVNQKVHEQIETTGSANLMAARHAAAMDMQREKAFAAADAIAAHGEALMDDSSLLAENSELVETAAVNYGDLISSIQSAQSETDKYNETNADLKKQQQEVLAQIQKLSKQGYSEQGKTIQDEYTKLSDLNGKLNENTKAHQKWAAQTVFSFAQARAAADGNITEGEGKVLIAVGEQLGLFDEKTAKAMENINSAFADLDSSSAEDTIDAVRRSLEELTSQTWNINLTASTPTIPGGGGCFIAGTLVAMSDGNYLSIEDVIVGDAVLAYDLETQKRISTIVKNIFHHQAHETESYLLVNGMGVTPDHLIMTSTGWRRAGDLKVGDRLIDLQGAFVVIEIIEKVMGNVPVYNLHVDHECHNYFADGVLVHNGKKALTLAGTSANLSAAEVLFSNYGTINVYSNDSNEFMATLIGNEL